MSSSGVVDSARGKVGGIVLIAELGAGVEDMAHLCQWSGLSLKGLEGEVGSFLGIWRLTTVASYYSVLLSGTLRDQSKTRLTRL
jgi:hypothetical protein